jgi:hypothetical protein
VANHFPFSKYSICTSKAKNNPTASSKFMKK